MMAQSRPLEHRRCSSDQHCRRDTRRRGRPSVERNGRLGESRWTASGGWSPGWTVNLALDEGCSRQGVGGIVDTGPQNRDHTWRCRVGRHRNDEDRIQRGHHALRILDVGGLVAANLGYGLERSVRLRVAVRDQPMMAGFIHRVVDVCWWGERQQAERGHQRDAQSPERSHSSGSVPVGPSTSN